MIEQDNVLDVIYSTSQLILWHIDSNNGSCSKNRSNQDVFFIDASWILKGKNQNNLTDTQLARIVDTYDKRGC